MKRAARVLRAWLLTLLVLLAFLLVIVVALCLRVIYETVMLVPRVVQAERRPPGPLPDIEPDMVSQTWGYEAASWPEHLVREDREEIDAWARELEGFAGVRHHPV